MWPQPAALSLSLSLSLSLMHDDNLQDLGPDTDFDGNIYNQAMNVNVTIQVPQYYTSTHDSDNYGDGYGYPSALHKIHVEPFLSSTEAARCLELAVAYGQGSSAKWKKPDHQRHTNYATCDFPVEEAPDLYEYLMGSSDSSIDSDEDNDGIDFQTRIFTRLSQAYRVDYDDLLGFIDLFCVNYVAKGNGIDSESSFLPLGESDETMDRLEAHRDGSILSFTVLLTPPDQFQGGGTFFEALRRNHNDDDDDNNQLAQPSQSSLSPVSVLSSDGVIRPPQAGYAVLHCGKLLHGADVVTQGQRTVLVGFVDVADWAIRQGVERRACTLFGRMDVAERRAHLQQQSVLMATQKCGGRLERGWSANRSARFLPKSSCFNRVIPAFDTAINRANPDFQRRSRLEAEDLLLRTILLDEKPESIKKILLSGDISIL